MSTADPLVSVGLPVYNGGAHLEQALASLRAQSLADWELIISDNASTDDTEAICRRHAAADGRIRYHRLGANIGAGPNYNRVFHDARGRYFKWAAHDDYMDPGLLQTCAARLEAHPAEVLCHGLLVDVDVEGRELAVHDRGEGGAAPAPDRFWTMIRPDHNCAEIFGLIRRDVLARSQLIRDYTDSDRTLLAQLALAGPMRQERDVRFYRRVHAGKSDRVYRDYNERAEWFNPANRTRVVLSATLQARDLTRVILGAGVSPREKARCFCHLARHIKWSAPVFRREFAWGLRRLVRRS